MQMTDHHEDASVRRAIAELQSLPAVSDDTIARVARVAMADAVRGGADDDVDLPRRNRTRLLRYLSYAAVAAAACVVGYVAHGRLRPHAPTVSQTAARPATAAAPAANDDRAARPVAQQFVFQNRTAHSVALVGDFNGWNPAAAPLVRVPGSGLWSVTVTLTPGRHAYAFIVDDSQWTLDPRAPTERDRDLGSPESVILVGHP